MIRCSKHGASKIWWYAGGITWCCASTWMITINKGARQEPNLGADRLQIDRLGGRIFKVKSGEDRV